MTRIASISTHPIAVPRPLPVWTAHEEIHAWSVILTEVNRFAWPGFDLRPIAGREPRIDYGFVPPALFEQIRAGILRMVRSGKRTTTPRN